MKTAYLGNEHPSLLYGGLGFYMGSISISRELALLEPALFGQRVSVYKEVRPRQN